MAIATAGIAEVGIGAAGIASRGIGYTNMPRLMLAATRVQIPANVLAYSSSQVHRLSKMIAGSPDYTTRNLRIVLPCFATNAAISGEVGIGNDLPIEGATVSINGGTFLDFTFSNSTTVTIGDNSFVISDPLVGAGDIAPLSTFEFRTEDTITTGQSRPGGGLVEAGNGEATRFSASSLSSLLHGGAVTGNGSTASNYGPCMVIAEGWDGRDVALMLGTSVGFGTEDRGLLVDSRGNSGYIARGLDGNASGFKRLPAHNWCVASSTAAESTGTGAGFFQDRAALIVGVQAINGGRLPFTKILSEHGVNDSNTSNPATMQAVMQAWWDFLHSQFGCPILQTTWPPRTTTSSGNQFQSQAVQTEATNHVYPTGAQWVVAAFVETVPVPLFGAIPVEAYFSDLVNIGKFVDDGYTTTLAADAALGDLVISVNDAPPANEVVAVGIGSSMTLDAGANLAPLAVNTVTGTGPYSVTLWYALTKAHSSGEVVAGIPTFEGTHPSHRLHLVAEQAIVNAKQSGVLTA